jgi:hypothetical protein
MKNEAYRKARAAFELLGVTNFKDLSIAYSAADQELMKKGIWYHKGNSVPNLVKTLIENIDPEELDEKDKQWWREIMWFWYHHAISSALRMSGDRIFFICFFSYFFFSSAFLNGNPRYSRNASVSSFFFEKSRPRLRVRTRPSNLHLMFLGKLCAL